MPIAMTQEQQALQASLRDWAKRAAPVALAVPEPGNRLTARRRAGQRTSWAPWASSLSPWTAAR